ncbi:MBL fold metallo-hydrolase [Agrobacterium vitis]|uniref:MBL fold metallo-hydrolase n=1 Tax=Agrobacterium vitis TaxID=373 RepID=UPI00087206A1|nr:MBL fold metallo-hydrolase [Agrobacterium vitis]MCE6073965.1 MBL fold metallo-hydrolase [Agrobacterium vitis]MCM2450505.1 MBL fold metallo-hydrolase [Agrobacterium vitis]MCM2468796.1 MBL fold metallo-hydrolase [Agrobacterium vitis]MUO71489.1 MBL fold metallo-hydrolase [Agrobacterium vitis]MUO86121.1 MBL fold metallo-hydrolase [Agrobacterium vitis]
MSPYHFTLGAAEIFAIQDGVLTADVGKLYRRNGEPVAEGFADAATSLSVNCFLIKTPERTVLIDTGSGQLFGPDHGKLSAGLAALGLSPADIDDIILTHIHADHTGGLVRDGAPIFPKATVHAGRTETDFWLSPGAADGPDVTERVKGQIGRAHLCLDPYEAEGRLTIFDDNGPILPGFSATLRAGHTPGHLVVRFESEGMAMLFVGDIVHGENVQFRDPSITIDFDYDQTNAAKARAQVFEQAADAGYLIAAAHLPFPGVGSIRKEGAAYQFETLQKKDEMP